MKKKDFSERILKWFDQHGRKNLPWQHPRNPYTTWLSELMLQQTQVQTVIPYFERFMQRFPNLETLAKADEDQVMAYWAGLGYYTRARNLLKTAQIIFFDYQGRWPDAVVELTKLPGIGQSTAAAIVSQAFKKYAPILDGNVVRVLSRYFMVDGLKNESKTKKILWQLAHACMPDGRFDDYTQAIMDLGALCCTPKNPQCFQCPVNQSCQAFNLNAVDRYPEKKIRNPLPVKNRYFIILLNTHHQIFLEKNPPNGIWGSLWTLPSTETQDDLPIWFEQHTIETFSNPKALAIIKHSFTHYHLVLHPFQFTVSNIMLSEKNWFAQNEAQALGLPVPIKKIIQNVFFSSSGDNKGTNYQ